MTGDGVLWKVTSRSLNLMNAKSTYVFTIAIPREDFFEKVESSIQRGIFEKVESSIQRGILASSNASALGLIGTVGVAILIVTPIRRMVNNMAKATKFEFRELEDSLKLAKPSIFLELQTLQITFATMIGMFATAIQNSRRLSNANTSTVPEF
ncbi:hypothetical protein BJ742DRAFT_159278 [Cladochytrium replicatum]|nr:hypothetical protein BJ742DRAFT_159278 [Cladochytrium replicatum]